jgi:nucleoside-diphosphate-sugar epimerase
MRVFVTGATGLLGRHVVQGLVVRGDSVVGLARSEEAARALAGLGAGALRGDVADATALERGVAEADAVVHASAVVLANADWPAFHAANVAPTERIAAAAARCGRRLVHISSVAVYGRRKTYDGGAGSVDEDFGLEHPIFPGDHYARSKREGEQAVWRIAGETGLRAVALRPCVIYGEGDRHFSPRVAAALRWRVAPMIGPGTNPLSVVYAGNVAAAVLAALDRPAVTGPFNVANDGGLTLREFVERFAAGLGVRIRVVRVPAGAAWRMARLVDAALRLGRPRAPMALLKTAVQFLSRPNPYSSLRAERQLGWRPAVPAAEAAELTGRAFRRVAH